MCRQQDNRSIACLLDLSQFFQHFLVDADLLEHVLEYLVDCPSHCSDNSWPYLAH